MTADNLREPDKLAAFLALDDAARAKHPGSVPLDFSWMREAWEAVPLLRAALKVAQDDADDTRKQWNDTIAILVSEREHHSAYAKLCAETRETERTAAAAREAAIIEITRHRDHAHFPWGVAIVADDHITMQAAFSDRAREILALAEDGKKSRAEQVRCHEECSALVSAAHDERDALATKLATAEEKARKWDDFQAWLASEEKP